MGKVTTRSGVRVAIVAVAGLAVLWVAVAAIDSHLDPFDDRPFDPDVWAAAEWYDRMPMARGAVARVPAGMTEADVVRLLGPPNSVADSHGLTGSAPARAVRTYSYDLGGSSLSSLRGLDSAFVWVHLDGDGRVVTAVIGGG